MVGTHSSTFKRTKIIATIGPATYSAKTIEQLIKSGANGLRLNFSHGTHDEHAQMVAWVRKASKSSGKLVALIQDLQGPKIRLGDFDGVVTVTKGDQLRFCYKADYDVSDIIPTQYDLTKKVKRGERILLYDGKIEAVVTAVRDGIVYAQAHGDGVLFKRRSMNLPDTDFGGDIITAKDKRDLAFASTLDFDYVAMSFVQSAADVHAMRKLLKNLNSKAKIIVKLETRAGAENVEEIVKASDAVMIARGDLAAETSPESVPILQRKIIELGKIHARPTIVATQMLLSMTESPEPTRAEVSDVATAVMLGADAVMLSDETASGKYPVEAVKTMKRVIRYAEDHGIYPNHVDERGHITSQEAICIGAISLARHVHAVAIVAETRSGATARQISALRPRMPIIAVTSDSKVAQQLTIVYGIKSYIRPDSRYAATRLTDWLKKSQVLASGDTIVSASGKYPGVVGTTDTIKIRVLE